MNTLPRGCEPLPLTWPALAALPPLQLAACRFEPLQPSDEDYARLGLEPIPGVAKRQMEYLAGRSCAARALQALGGDPRVGRNAERAPLWPAGFVGSISHSQGLALAVVGRQQHWRALGLDLESRLPAARAARLAGEVLTGAEQERLQDLSEEQQAQRISLSFSLKESLFKALFPLTGVRFYFADAEVLDCADGQATLRLLRSLSAEWPAGSQLQGHWLALEERLLSLVTVQA